MNRLVFEDSIILYWDKEWELPDGIDYLIYLNGKEIAKTKKTHYTFSDLESQKSYDIKIERIDLSGEKAVFFEETILTPNKRERIDVTKAPYNAVGDGKTLNTKALQQAIDDCKEGQTVYIPKGEYLTGGLMLHSDMELFLDDAILQGSKQVEDYLPKVKTRFEGYEMECYRSLINMGSIDRNGGYNCQNVVIRGKGKIIGGGKTLAQNTVDVEKELLKEFMESNKELVAACENINTLPGRARGRLINMCNCKNVVLCGLEMGMGPAWNIHFIYSKQIVTCNSKIFSYRENEHVWNGDGWNPDSSEDCTLFNTIMDTYDDGIAIKSGKNPEGNIINRPSRNIRVFDCFGAHGVAVGSELSGGVENVYVWDCEFPYSFYGISVKTTKERGGYVKNLIARNCKFVGIGIRTKYGTNLDGESAKTLTVLENFTFQNIYFYAEKPNRVIYPDDYKFPIYLDGFDGEGNGIKNVVIKDVVIEKYPEEFKKQIYVNNVSGLLLEDVKIK